MSKGSGARPFSVPRDEFAAKFDAIFRKQKAPTCECQPGQCKLPAERCKDWGKRGGRP